VQSKQDCQSRFCKRTPAIQLSRVCLLFYRNSHSKASLQEKLLSLQLYVSGLSLRRIGYLLQVFQVTIQKWLQKLVLNLCLKLKPEGRALVMELDEMRHYLQSKKTNSGSGKLCVVIPVDSLTGNLGVVIEKL
jgi:hypothetical protein